MARHFVGLKLTLIRNGLRTGWQRSLGLVVASMVAVPVGVAGFGLLAAMRSHPADARMTAVLVFAALTVGWIVFPVLGFGSDETLDPSRLALLPLSRRQLMTGLFVASCIGVPPLATLLVLLGAFVAFSTNVAVVPIVALAVVTELALCLAASRAVVTALSALLRSRRGRDVTLTLVAALGVLFQLARFTLLSRTGKIGRGALESTVGWLGWTPPGLAARSMASAQSGRFGEAVFELAGAVIAVALLVSWWAHSLDRVSTTVEGQARRARASASMSLFPRVLGFLPRDRVGAVTAKELRYLMRDPRRRALLIPALFLPLLPVLSTAAAGGATDPRVTLAAVAATFVVAQIAFNQFGVDGPAYWMNVAAGTDPRADITGKNLAAVITTMPVVTLSAALLATVTGGWRYLPLVFPLALGAVGIQLGVANVASVRFPQPVLEGRANPWATTTGQGCTTGVLALIAQAVALVLLLPLALGVFAGLVVWPPALVVIAPLGVVYGSAIWWLGRRSAVRWVWWRQAELLEAIGPRQVG